MKRIHSLIFTTILAILLTVTALPKSGQAAEFSDVPDSHFAKEEIDYLVDQEIIKGREDGTFGKNDNITRVEAAIMFKRALQPDLSSSETPPFPDVESHEYAEHIAIVEKEGIIEGFPDGTFRPDNEITRADVTIMLQRAFSLDGDYAQVYFPDVASYHYAHDAIYKAASAGVLNGYPTHEFKPQAKITRAEFAVALARGLEEDFRVPPEKESVIETVYVIASDSLNVRTGPSTAYKKLGALPKGSAVDVYSYTSNDWAKIRYNDDWAYISARSQYVSDEPPVKGSIKNKTIVVDAGHGGDDPGAIGNDLKEKDVTLDTARRLNKKLQAKGANVVMTRNSDVYLSLDERVNAAYRANGDAFVSIHANSYSDPDVSGSETYYYRATVKTRSTDDVRTESKQLARAIQNRLAQELDMNDRGIKHGNFHVLRENIRMPSTLVELGFITNESDAEKLASPSWRDRAAEAIALGIEDYFQEKG